MLLPPLQTGWQWWWCLPAEAAAQAVLAQRAQGVARPAAAASAVVFAAAEADLRKGPNRPGERGWWAGHKVSICTHCVQKLLRAHEQP